jgi:predicted kinase
MLLILISGPPCTGKTTLGQRLAEELHLPFIHKDGIKETLFDALGWEDREWSRQLGGASYDLLFYFTECLLRGGCSFIAEANFGPAHEARFQAWQGQYKVEIVQIDCYTEREVLVERFKLRSESGERHPGHVDHLNYEEVSEAIAAGKYDFPNVGNVRLVVDTTELSTIPYATIIQTIKAAL